MLRNMQHAVALGALLLCGLGTLPGLGAAPARSPNGESPAELVELARAAKAQFQPLPKDHAAKAKAKLAAGGGPSGSGTASRRSGQCAAWREYLEWDAMMAELGKTDSSPDVRKLGGIATRYYQDHGSLDLPVFTRVRDDLVAYLTALATAGDERLAENYTAQLDQLIEKLPQYDADTHDRTAAANRAVAGVAGKCQAGAGRRVGGSPTTWAAESVCRDLGAHGVCGDW